MYRAARRRLILPFLLPQLVLYTFVTFASIVATVALSLTNWTGVNPPRFIGLRNFSRLLADRAFRSTFGNSIYYVVAGGILLIVFAVALAWCLHQLRRGKRLYRFIILAPAVVSVSVAALMWKWIYSPLFGVLGQPLHNLGHTLNFEPLLTGLLRGSSTSLTLVILTHLWHGMGTWVILILAGLQRLPPEVLEAAYVDGASERQAFRYVTLPLMWEILRIVIVLWIMAGLQAFSYVFVMRSRGVMATYVYSTTFGRWDWAYGMSLATAMMAGIFVIVLLTNRLLRREVEEF